MDNDAMTLAMASVLGADDRRIIWGDGDPPASRSSVRALRHWHASERHAMGVHRHLSTEVCVALSGPTVMEVGSVRHAVEPPMVCVLQAGVDHCESWRRRDRAYVSLWMVVMVEGVTAAVVRYDGRGDWSAVQRHWLHTPSARALGRLLAEPDVADQPRRNQRLKAVLLPLLAEFYHDQVESAPLTEASGDRLSAADAMVLHVRGIIDARPDKRPGVEELARLMHVSPSYLNRMFRRRVGQSLYAYVLGSRMQEAMRLLRTTDLLVKQVAANVGFDDPLHFSRQFRRRYGMRPTRVRRPGIS